MASYRGKHRKQSIVTRTVTGIAVAGAVVAAPLALAGTAQAAPGMDWDALAKCESGGNYSINTGNGYYGAFQFNTATWQSNGGGKYAPNAHQATREQQQEIAQRLYDARGAQPWPVCGRKAGSGGGSAKPAAAPKPEAKTKKVVADKPQPVKKAAPKPAAPVQAPVAAPAAPAAPVAAQKNGADYTVVAGDTLSTIAQKQGVQGGWKAVFERNKDVVKDANLIFPGQQLDVK